MYVFLCCDYNCCLMSNNLCLTFFCNRTVKYNVIGLCTTIAADLGWTLWGHEKLGSVRWCQVMRRLSACSNQVWAEQHEIKSPNWSVMNHLIHFICCVCARPLQEARNALQVFLSWILCFLKNISSSFWKFKYTQLLSTQHSTELFHSFR